MRQIVFFLLLQCFSLPGWSVSSLPDVGQSYFYDPENTLTIDAIDTAAFTPYVGGLNLGFKSGSLWVRLLITPVEMQSSESVIKNYTGNPFIIRCGPHYLDEINLYEKSEGKWTHTIAGDLYRNPITKCVDDFHCFAVQESAQQSQVVYLKIKSTGLLNLDAEVVRLDSVIFRSIKRVRKISVSLTIACALLVLGMIFFFTYRSKLLKIFCLLQVSIILFICSKAGIFAHLLPDFPLDVIDKFGHITFILRVYLQANLCREFFAQYQVTKVFKRLVVFVSIACGFTILPVLLGYTNLGYIIITLLFLTIPLIQIYGVLTTPDIPKTFRAILLIASPFFFIMVATGWLVGTGLIPSVLNLFEIRGLADARINGVFTSLFLFWLILAEQNIREKAKSQDIIKLRLDAAEAQANEEKLIDRNMMIDMLTHELKNPLATIKFALTSVKRNFSSDSASLQRFKHIDLCVERMNKLIEHVARSSKFDRASELNPSEIIAAAPLIHDLIEEYAESWRFTLNIEEGISFMANREILTIILENIINNSYKYADTLSSINISVTSSSEIIRDEECKGNSIFISVSNMAGVLGVPDESRLFERYYRHSHAQSVSGLGIGLSLVKAAAKKIGATVHYRHVDGRVTFTVRMPN